ncbi:DUF4974 domain-containing protein [Chitinophaga agrisoli]|uniref:DUF4974 domain-containing protein n=1 Tax=Chitinophaga agrisoli TaxID=2607653 RepID=A0A5B2W4U3_9BACT|nr:FecR family protein [Chitinophaga agrisoli]KAA2245730.1 DUF4974 domain-containing protein [Chitinophaga agrisoli]
MQPDLIALLEKYLSGSLTETEQQLLAALLEEEGNQRILAALIDQQLELTGHEPPEYAPLKAASFRRLEAAMDRSEEVAPARAVSRWRRLRPFAVAASILLVLAAGLYLLAPRRVTSMPAPSEISYAQAVPYTRHIILPDSSTIILRANSTLQLGRNFNTKTREVVLIGEAYFDIRHSTGKPFIVHTGALKTTVLGTAFNIIAYAGARQVTVAVTKGKVKIEDHQKTVATLMPDCEMVYTLNDSTAAQQPVDAYSLVTSWTKKEVLFEAISFGSIADILSRRYGVTIRFRNNALKECHVRTAFKGTESLPEVLDLLCTAMNASYTINDSEGVMISGDGCN